MSQTTISQLAHLISNSVATLERVCQENQLAIPDLDSPGFTPQSEAFRANTVAAEMAKLAAAACLQLSASLLPPTDAVFQLAAGVCLCFLSNCPLFIQTQRIVVQLLSGYVWKPM